jgi:hypothetical protein
MGPRAVAWIEVEIDARIDRGIAGSRKTTNRKNLHKSVLLERDLSTEDRNSVVDQTDSPYEPRL